MVGFQGNFDPFARAFPNDLVPSVFMLMLKEWPNALRPAGNPLENRITNRFVGHLRRVMRDYELPLFKFGYRPKMPDPDSDSPPASDRTGTHLRAIDRTRNSARTRPGGR